jgi:hypothetical protein
MTTTTELLRRVRLVEPRYHSNLAMFPLLLPDWPAAPGYTVLEEALSNGFRVTEVSEGGSVPMLRATNKTSQPVFLLDGEELKGARQNRVLNLSLLVPAGVEMDIPVSCVEAGRWRWQSPRFAASGHAQFAEGRASKLRSVSESLHNAGGAFSDQREVWDTISAKAARLHAPSPTAAMAAMYERHALDLEGSAQRLEAQAGQGGAVFVAGGQVIGLDLFDHPATYAKLHDKLVRSYALDAMEHVPSPAVKAEDVQRFIASITRCRGERFHVAGAGDSVRLSGEGIVGASLEDSDRCIHLTAFPAGSRAHAWRRT